MRKSTQLDALRTFVSLFFACVLAMGGLPTAAIAEIAEGVSNVSQEEGEVTATEEGASVGEAQNSSAGENGSITPASSSKGVTEDAGSVFNNEVLLAKAQSIASDVRSELGESMSASAICERVYLALAKDVMNGVEIVASCSDAARVASLAMDELGVASAEVVDGGDLAWNMVQVDETWYHMDAWSAGMAWRESPEGDEAPRSWLLVGDETLRGMGVSSWTLLDGTQAPEAPADYVWQQASSTTDSSYGLQQVTTQGEKGTQTVTLGATNYEKVVGDAVFSLGATTTGDGMLSYAPGDSSVATVDESGSVTVVAVGTTTITVTAAETDSYNQATATATLTVKNANPLDASAKKESLALSYSATKDQATPANITTTSAQGEVEYANASSDVTAKKFSVNKTTGVVTVPKGTAVGTYGVIVRTTAAGNNDYAKGTKDVSFNIVVSAASIADASVSAIADQAYTGKAVTPKPTVKLADTTLKENTDYTLEYNNNTNAGTATVSILAKGNYTGTKKATYKIVAPTITYRAHVQTYGNQDWKKNGQTSGTSGQSKRLEGIWIKLDGQPVTGSVQYRTHVQGIGWQGWKADGTMSGTSAQSRRLEAIQIKLTGDMASRYDVYYRVHSQTYGWMGWAKNGATSGTAGQSKRLEGIQIVLIAKNGTAPSSSGQNTAKAFIGNESISLSAHIQKKGWVSAVGNGQVSGTVGESLRLEALRASLNGACVPGGIQLQSHIQDSGWTGWEEGSTGTVGKGLRMQGLQMRLTGEAASVYDLYYRVHLQGVGWLAWASEGEVAGAPSVGLRIEAVQATLVKQGASKPSGSSDYPLPEVKPLSINYASYVQGSGWQNSVANGKTSGTTNKSLRVEGLNMTLSGDCVQGGVSYRAHMQDSGWQSWKSNGTNSGLPGQGKRVEAIAIKLTGTAAKIYNIWYRAYVQGTGWMGWTCNGANAGTSKLSLRIEAIQVCLRSRNVGAPGSTSVPYRVGGIREGLEAASGASSLTTFGGYSASSGVTSRLNSAISSIHNSGYQVGFIMMDINTQKGIAYNCDQVFYGASSIKAPYIASVVSKYPDVLSKYAYDIHQTLIYSWDYNYKQVYYAYGTDPMRAWCSASGARSSICNALPWADFSARDLALLWGQNYKLFTSSSAGETYGTWCEEPETCAIHKVLGGKYRTRSKAGWIADGGKYNVTNDGGIVYAANGPYVIAIMSSIPAQMNMLNNLVSAIDAAHSTM